MFDMFMLCCSNCFLITHNLLHVIILLQVGREPTVRSTLMDVLTLCALRGWSVWMCLPQGWVPCVDLVLKVTMEMEQSVLVS